jgi:hypothetical protein
MRSLKTYAVWALNAILLVCGSVVLAQSPAEEAVIIAFREYISRHLSSYEQDNRLNVYKLGCGWAKIYYKVEGEYSIDVQRTSSLISPYIGVCEFKLRRHYTACHPTKEGAQQDSRFVNTDANLHKHMYAYQDNKWVPKKREYYMVLPIIGNKWFSCDDPIVGEEEKGKRTTGGCIEK